MDGLINGRTTEEIKAGLKACTTGKVPGYGCNTPCPYLNTPNCWLPVKSDALALIERLESERDAALAKVPKWIGVEDRLPEESGYYLYLCNSPIRGLQNGVGVSYFQHKAKLWKKVYNPCVTHWMPLPESKKEDA